MDSKSSKCICCNKRSSRQCCDRCENLVRTYLAERRKKGRPLPEPSVKEELLLQKYVYQQAALIRAERKKEKTYVKQIKTYVGVAGPGIREYCTSPNGRVIRNTTKE